jgi:hypothetical protein
MQDLRFIFSDISPPASHWFLAWLLGLFFDPADASNMFLRNVDSLPMYYTALYLRKQSSFFLTLLGSDINIANFIASCVE